MQFTMLYDAENRLTSLEYTDSSGVLYRQEFRYRGDGLLAEQTFYENGTLVDTIRIVRDGMLAIQDRNANNTVVNESTWGLNLGGGIGGLLNLKQDGQNYSYLYDGKGNVEAVLDAPQNVVAAYRYDPFGILLNQDGSLTQPFGFSTKRHNPSVGMVQYEFRNYFPDVARWDRRDPIGEAGGLNLYAFVGNNPVNWVDPLGLLPPATNSIDGFMKDCLTDPNPQIRIDCLQELLDYVDDRGQIQRIYQHINTESTKLLKDFRGFTKSINSSSRKIAEGRKIDKVKKLVERFGGEAKDWIKKKGWDECGKEWHWYEHKSIGKIGVKPSGAPDPWFLQ